MYQHHIDSIEKLKAYFAKQSGIVALVLGGSVAKGKERPDSDLDALVIVTDERFAEQEAKGVLSECVMGECTYEDGYFDIKYSTANYLRALVDKGSEPSRNAFLGCKILWCDDPEVAALIERVPQYPAHEREEKRLSFYATLELNAGYFWDVSNDNIYLRTRTCADVVLFGLRLVLAEHGVLFPCHKALFATVAELPGTEALLQHATNLLREPTDERKQAFMDELKGCITYVPPENYAVVLTRFIDDNELWWYKDRPVITEW